MALEEGPVTRPLMMGPPVASMPSPGDVSQQQSGYSVPGVLHFIKHEFSRFERERANWEVERAELQAKIAFLQGERKGHDNLMRDLVRRIKMLEFALKQERLKLHKLQHGGSSDLVVKSPQLDNETTQQILEAPSLTNQRESRRILREYLREVGFPDNVLEARVARINLYRTLMTGTVEGSAPPLELPVENYSGLSLGPPEMGSDIIPNGTDTEEQLTRREEPPSKPADNLTNEDSTEAMLEQTFDFLRDQDSDDEDDPEMEENPIDTQDLLKGLERNINKESSELDREGTEVDPEFVYGPSYETSEGGGDIGSGGTKGENWPNEFIHQVKLYQEHKNRKKTKLTTARPSKDELRQLQQYSNLAEETTPPSNLPGMGMIGLPGRQGRQLSSRRAPDERIEVSLGIDDLVGLSISNEATIGSDSPVTESVRRWEHKYTMRSHFDAVTCVTFHPLDDVLVSGSEDSTIKLWSIQKSSQTKKSAIVDVEPTYTFRGHYTPVLSVGVSPDGEVVYSGSADGQLRLWQIPTNLSDPFDVYDPEVQRGLLEGHDDAIWGLVVNQSSGLIMTCSADKQCILWDPQLSSPQLKCLISEPGLGTPTCVDFVHSETQQAVVGYSSAKAVIYDLETCQAVVSLDSAVTYDGTSSTQINKLVCHPTLPIIITAHEDKYIRFFDSKSGQVIHSMTAHMDAVTGLAIDPHGLYILSGSHDGSLRFWSMESKTCVQEITAHRKRFDESIYNVACHLTKPYFASAGADGIAKVLV